MINDNNYNKIDTFHGQVVAYLPMVFSTSKPKPLLDFPAVCISFQQASSLELSAKQEITIKVHKIL
jgi:hypothetical protein